MALKYKVGDRVKIKSLNWYDKNKDRFGEIWTESFDRKRKICFASNMTPYCGMETVIFSVERYNYVLKNIPYAWTDEMIEGLAEEDKEMDKFIDLIEYHSLKHEILLPDGYIFKDENGNVINAQKIALEKKKKEYPKTYEECCKVLDWNHRDYDRVGYESELLCKFQVLLLCRDAYWKIAGEEMGLWKPWTPDWKDNYEKKWTINFYQNEINLTNGPNVHFVLAFPTEEMRDAFYDNFKALIEICKELL